MQKKQQLWFIKCFQSCNCSHFPLLTLNTFPAPSSNSQYNSSPPFNSPPNRLEFKIEQCDSNSLGVFVKLEYFEEFPMWLYMTISNFWFPSVNGTKLVLGTLNEMPHTSLVMKCSGWRRNLTAHYASHLWCHTFTHNTFGIFWFASYAYDTPSDSFASLCMLVTPVNVLLSPAVLFLCHQAMRG